MKLRVSWNRKSRYFPTSYDMTEKAFAEVYSPKPSKEAKAAKLQLNVLLGKASTIVDSLKHFSFDAFTNALYADSPKSCDVFSYYKSYMQELEKEGRAGTHSNYESSMKSLKGFLLANRRSTTSLTFEEISVSFLKSYEKYMLDKRRSITTVGIYLRPLRALYIQAIQDGNASKELYPFGKRRYQIPARRKAKKALDKRALKKLFQAELSDNPKQQRARDFWFFSYCCNGINLKDVALLRWENIDDERIVFVCAKTRLTTKTDQREIIVCRTEFINRVIERYGCKSESGTGLVFDILQDGLNAMEQRRLVLNHVRFVNQHMKVLAASLGVTADLSYVWARHSFTTNAIRDGATMEEVQESLGHQNIMTTQNYFAGFDDERKKKLANKLMDFSSA